VSVLEDNQLQDTYAVNLTRASTSQGFIITKAVVINRFLFANPIATFGSNSALTMLCFKLFTLVVNCGDNTCVLSTIDQKLIG